MKSNLQIISGKHRAKKLFLPDSARPTQNLARGALFNMLNLILDTSKHFVVWDVFGGSGIFGIECLSRYNCECIFTDNANTSINTILMNLNSVKEQATVECIDAIKAIDIFAKKADLLFVDPPYNDHELGICFIRKISKEVKPGTIVIWEFENTNNTPAIDNNWCILKDKIYGRARFLFLQKN